MYHDKTDFDRRMDELARRIADMRDPEIGAGNAVNRALDEDMRTPEVYAALDYLEPLSTQANPPARPGYHGSSRSAVVYEIKRLVVADK